MRRITVRKNVTAEVRYYLLNRHYDGIRNRFTYSICGSCEGSQEETSREKLKSKIEQCWFNKKRSCSFFTYLCCWFVAVLPTTAPVAEDRRRIPSGFSDSPWPSWVLTAIPDLAFLQVPAVFPEFVKMGSGEGMKTPGFLSSFIFLSMLATYEENFFFFFFRNIYVYIYLEENISILLFSHFLVTSTEIVSTIFLFASNLVKSLCA